ncbi:hypothetical protein X946_5526 [Burkholderia sp. ABCPW 111]|nr:hypothetical protein X946_5526 [Burkholderia sp. ABCPW 111]
MKICAAKYQVKFLGLPTRQRQHYSRLRRVTPLHLSLPRRPVRGFLGQIACWPKPSTLLGVHCAPLRSTRAVACSMGWPEKDCR